MDRKKKSGEIIVEREREKRKETGRKENKI